MSAREGFEHVGPDQQTWDRVSADLVVGQRFTGTVVHVPRPGSIGVVVDLGLPAIGFVDVLHLPRDPRRWPPVGVVTTFEVVWFDDRRQIRLVPLDPAYRDREG